MQLAIITDKTAIKVTQPSPFPDSAAYRTPYPSAIELTKTAPVSIFTSPDYAYAQLIADLSNARKSIGVYVSMHRFISLTCDAQPSTSTKSPTSISPIC